jgi:branched-chain amino acid transport system substrate-binding protein
LIGNVGSYSGVVAPQEVPVLQGAQAWAQAINAKGGINGHPVHLIAADDGIDAGRNRSLVQRMVEQDHVIAFVGVGNALTIQGSADYLLQKRIPVVGGDAAHFIWKNNPMFFPEGAPGDDLNFNTIANLAEEKPGIEFAAFGCAEIQNCRDFVDQAPGNARKLGVKLVYQATPSIAQPDYTAECINAASKGAKAIAILIDSTSLIRIAQSCARQNYKPLFAITTSMAAPELLREPALDQTTVSVNTFPFPQGSTPAEAEFQAAIKRNFPDAGLNAGHAQGWVSGKLFERVVRDTPSDVSTATVLEGLWSLKGETLEGLAAPLTFLRDKPAPGNRCLYHVKIESGKYTAPWGSKVVCH